jgi:hypothetical protein
MLLAQVLGESGDATNKEPMYKNKSFWGVVLTTINICVITYIFGGSSGGGSSDSSPSASSIIGESNPFLYLYNWLRPPHNRLNLPL